MAAMELKSEPIMAAIERKSDAVNDTTISTPPFLPWTYHPDVVDANTAREYYKSLVNLVKDLPQQKVRVRGKVYDQRRIVGYFSKSNNPYSYSGARQVNSGWPDVIQTLCTIASKLANCSYDSALVNWYRDGNDKIGLHNDKDAMTRPIVSFTFYPDANPSLDQLRVLRIRSQVEQKSLKRKRESEEQQVKKTKPIVYNIKMGQGSVVLMHDGMQTRFNHEVPENKKSRMGRINVTFRVHS